MCSPLRAYSLTLPSFTPAFIWPRRPKEHTRLDEQQGREQLGPRIQLDDISLEPKQKLGNAQSSFPPPLLLLLLGSTGENFLVCWVKRGKVAPRWKAKIFFFFFFTQMMNISRLHSSLHFSSNRQKKVSNNLKGSETLSGEIERGTFLLLV